MSSSMSEGVLYQIEYGEQQDEEFSNALRGLQPAIQDQIFGDPYSPSGLFIQSCTWQSSSPLVHYTLEDLTGSKNETNSISAEPLYLAVTPLANFLSNLGKRNSTYNSGKIKNLSFELTSGTGQLDFNGVTDLPYAIWSSPNLLDWNQIGIASQPSPGSFQFNDPATTNSPARFYQVSVP